MMCHVIVKCMISVMDIKLGVSEIPVLKRKNRASLINKLPSQAIGIRPSSTLVDIGLRMLANRSESQRVVVKEDVVVESMTGRIIASKKVKKLMWNLLKGRKGDLALITTHPKLGINIRGLRKGLSFPMKGMARMTLNVHLTKVMNLPIRIKGLASNGQWSLRQMDNLIK